MHQDAAVFDFLKISLGYESDAQLMNWLGISRDSLSGIRTGRLPMGENIRFVILDKWWTQLRNRPNGQACRVPEASDTPPKSHEVAIGFSAPSLLEAVNARLAIKAKETRAPVDAGASEPKSVDGELLGAYKTWKGSATDAELASLLGIKRQSISMVRSGRNGLGPIPLLKIYEDLMGGDELGLQAAVQSSESMLSLLTRGKASAIA